MIMLSHQRPDRTFQRLHNRRQAGAAGNVLIYVVVLMLIFGALGVAMISLFASSTASTVTRNDTRRARYLSESGVRYAISEMRAADFEEDLIIDPLNTLTYTVSGSGTFELNILSPWFDAPTDIDNRNPNVISLSPHLGQLPADFTADPVNGVWVVNFDYITGEGPDMPTMRDEVTSYSTDLSGNLNVGITASFVARQDERIVLAVRPSSPQGPLSEGDDLFVVRDARLFFPKFNGAVNIDRVDYAYERLVDDPAGNRVILQNLTASQFPNTLAAFPLDVAVGTTGDFVVLSPRNYMVIAEGTSDAVTWGNAYALGMNIYDDSLIRPGARKPDITADDLTSNLSQQETDTRFFDPDETTDILTIGGGGTGEFGSAFFDADLNLGGERDYCQQGACLFRLGVRAFFLLDFSSQGDGITFTLINGANNRASSAGGDFELSELMGYAGDSRLDAAGSSHLTTAAIDQGLDPPKIAVEFDTRTNNTTLAYCNGANVNQNTRDDPLLNNQDAVQYVFWGREANVAQPCRDDPSYDDNRHGPGLWQFDDPTAAINSSPAVDPGDGTIYVGSNNNRVYAINPDGTRKWAFATGGIVVSSPAVGSDGTIYVGSNDNRVYAINPNGSQRWQFTTGGNVRSSPAIASDGTIFIGADDGILYAFDSAARTAGSPFPDVAAGEWATPNPVNPAAQFSLGRPAIGPAPARTIYVSDRDRTLFAVRPSDGAVLWTYDTRDGSDYMPGVDPSSGVIYSDIIGNNLVALNPGVSPPTRERWSLPVGSDIDSTPVVGPDGTVYFGLDTGLLFAVRELNPSAGVIIWQFVTGDEVDNIPALSPGGSVVYVVSNDNNLYAVDTAAGTENWSFEIDTSTGNVTSSPVVDTSTGVIYVGSDDTSVYALTPFDEEPKNLQGLLLTSADLSGVVVDSAINWLNGAASRGPWAVRLEVDRGALGDYELRLWMKQCINAACDNINTTDDPFPTDDPFFKDTRVTYQLSPPDMVQFFQLDAIKHAEFNRFLFGFTAAAGAQALNVTLANFALSFIRPGDPIIDIPEF